MPSPERTFYNLGRWPYNRLGRWPYAAALRLVQWRCASLRPRPGVWPRNSFLTEAFRPLKSDLDLTVWFDEEPTPEVARRMRGVLKEMKFVFPALGETNFYVGPSTRPLLPWMNRFEMRRDPKLCRLMDQRGSDVHKTSVRAERTVFLLRMLEADFYNLVRAPGERLPKWRSHMRMTGGGDERFEFGANAVAAVLDHAFDWIGEEFGALVKAAATASLEVYLHARFIGQKRDYRAGLNEVLVSSMAHRFSYLPEAHPFTKGGLREIALAQLAWELSGINSQRLLLEAGAVEAHLRNIAAHARTAATLNPVLAGEFENLAEAALRLSRPAVSA